MSLRKTLRRFGAAASSVLLASLLATGCTKNQATPPAPPPQAPGGAGLVAAGKTVFDSSGCTRCHALGGQGGRRGPDLSRVGADSRHTPQWLAAYVKNPRQQNPSSRMPAFGGRISDADLQALGAYLASLK